jgi:transcriptional regulator with XRE-family HTH domain
LLDHLAATIRDLRLNYNSGEGLSQEKLAIHLKVAPNTISRWETGTYCPSVVDLERIARFFGVGMMAFVPSELVDKEEEIGKNFEHLGEKIDEVIRSKPGIIAFFPEQYMAKPFHGKLLNNPNVSVSQFISGKEWYPTPQHVAQLGVLPLILGTLWVRFGAIVIALPFGLACAIYMAEIAPEKIRKMRFFQPHDYVALDYTTNHATISSLAPPTAGGAWPGVQTRNLEIVDVEPLRAEIVAFIKAAGEGLPSPISGLEGRNALALALRALKRIEEHASHPGVSEMSKASKG